MVQGISLWLDDVRPIPNGFTHWAKTAGDAMDILGRFRVDFISFDHDLGNDSLSGYDVASFVAQQVFLGRMKCPRWSIHSMNPVGAARIKMAMQQAERFSGEKE